MAFLDKHDSADFLRATSRGAGLFPSGLPITQLMNPNIAVATPSTPAGPVALPDVADCLTRIEAAVGLPLLGERNHNVRAGDRLRWHSTIGTLTHQVVAAVAPTIRVEDSSGIRRRIHDEIEARVRGRRLGRPDRAKAVITSVVLQYLTCDLPRAARFLGAEHRVRGARIDLAWRCPRVGVFFDELKTWTLVPDPLDEATIDQVCRYLDAGLAEYGEDFAGVRLLTLRQRQRAQWYGPDGLILPLAESPLSARALAEAGAA